MSDKHNSTLEERIHKSQHRFTLPAGARELILIRHGSAGGEKVGSVQVGEFTVADPPLRPDGHLQAQAVAQRLRGAAIASIYVTPLQRTQQTAAPLAAIKGIDPVVIPELREVHMGDWEHDFYAKAAASSDTLRRMMLEERWDVIPNAESMEAVAARVRTGVDKILQVLQAGATAVLFAHGGTIGEICRQATASRALAFSSIENASISRLIVQSDGRWTLRCFNDVSHLPETP